MAKATLSTNANRQPSLNHAVTRSGLLLGATEEHGHGRNTDDPVASYRALGKAIVKNKPMTRKDRARVAEYLREAGWRERAIDAATARVGTSGYADLRETG